MTQRKPPNMQFPDWIEAQIRTAEQAGAFENLPGKGKPIPGIDRPQGEMDWIVGKLRSENVDIVAVLPPALALAKEVEDLPARLAKERSEARVRALVTDLNDRIRRAQLGPQTGPPLRVRQLDVDEAIARWREELPPPAPAAPAVPTPAPRRRTWWRTQRRA
jgi:hypothetical protein